MENYELENSPDQPLEDGMALMVAQSFEDGMALMAAFVKVFIIELLEHNPPISSEEIFAKILKFVEEFYLPNMEIVQEYFKDHEISLKKLEMKED